MSATDHLNDLCSVLNQDRPIVLFLGQDAWSPASRADPVLQMALRRSGSRRGDAESPGFRALLEDTELPDDFYQWLADVYFRQPAPTWMDALSRLPLNAVFTSSIDPSLARAFRTNGRDVELVLSKFDNPPTPRSRRNLHLTHLFGRAGEQDPRERPPRNKLEFHRRAASHAAVLLSRIVETTTSLGVLLVDGLTCGRDWLSVDSLSGILSEFAPGQVYWFGWDVDELDSPSNPILPLTAPDGPVRFFTERLSAAIGALELAHRIDLSSSTAFAPEGSIRIGPEQTIEIDSATRLQVSTVASVVDDTWLGALPPLGPDAAYAQFRRFHGQAEDARRLTEGLRRGFAITRTFERDLRRRVADALKAVGRHRDPILLHGQSASGKSLALARLAYDVRAEARHPVLFASRIGRLPGVEELDDFCLKAEDAGADATLLICDANAPAPRYSDLLRGFMSRGRRVVVVGSAYRITDDDNDSAAHTSDLLAAPAELDAAESQVLAELLLRWTGDRYAVNRSQYLLPAMYRLLPDVRGRLAAGLAQEARVAEDNLRQRGAATSAAPPRSTTTVGAALVDAGIVDPKAILDQKIDDLLGALADAAAQVVDIVMVPGKLDCPVPINLLMRAVGGSDHPIDIVALFAGIDLFRWTSNDDDDLFVRPRLPLEAAMIAARRLGTPQAETRIALRLIESANPGSHGDSERRFVLDLVHKLGPDGPFGTRYAKQYLDIARALTTMRTQKGVMDPSFMLQEATLRRRMLRHSPDVPDHDSAAILEEARAIVEMALDEFGSSTSHGVFVYRVVERKPSLGL